MKKQMKRLIAGIENEVKYTRSLIGRSALAPKVMQAIAAVPRDKFVPAQLKSAAFDNGPLPIGYGQTISQPYIVALMTDLLALKPDNIVLEIGTGSGYQSAVLAEIVDTVTRQIIAFSPIPQGVPAPGSLATDSSSLTVVTISLPPS